MIWFPICSHQTLNSLGRMCKCFSCIDGTQLSKRWSRDLKMHSPPCKPRIGIYYRCKSGFGAHSGIASQDQSMATFDKKSNKNRNVFWFIASPACGLKPPTPIHGKVFPAIRDSAELSPAVGVDRHRSRSSSLASIPQHERTGNERGGHAPVWWEMSPTNFIIGDLWRFYFIIGFFRGSTGTQLFGKASGSGTNGGSCLKQKCQKQKYKLSWATWMLT